MALERKVNGTPATIHQIWIEYLGQFVHLHVHKDQLRNVQIDVGIFEAEDLVANETEYSRLLGVEQIMQGEMNVEDGRFEETQQSVRR